MIVWFKVSVDGHTVAEAGRHSMLPSGARQAPEGIEPSELAQLMVVGGELYPRPMSPDIQSDGTTHSIMDCPAGTVIEVYDVTGGERLDLITVAVSGTSEIISLPDTGTYSIEVQGPMPALPVRKVVQT